MRIISFTDRGRVRPTNDDALWMNGELGLFLVADGIGSSGRGAEASQAVVRACRDALKGSPHPDELLPTLLRRANNSLYEMGGEKGGSFGATAALLWIRGREARFTWVGDSRIYRLRGGTLERLTDDHTRASELAARGVVPPGAASRKSALTRSLGQSPSIDSKLGGPIEVRAGDVFMVATDGVTDLVDDESLRGLLARGPIAASGAIRQAVLEKGAPDNLTAVLVEVEPADLERTLDASQIAILLREAAERELRPSRQVAAGTPPPPPRGIAAFCGSVRAGGARRVAQEAAILAAFLLVAFLAPDILSMLGHRLESVSAGWFLGLGAALYLMVVKLRAG